jgi:hypothetical protein
MFTASYLRMPSLHIFTKGFAAALVQGLCVLRRQDFSKRASSVLARLSTELRFLHQILHEEIFFIHGLHGFARIVLWRGCLRHLMHPQAQTSRQVSLPRRFATWSLLLLQSYASKYKIFNTPKLVHSSFGAPLQIQNSSFKAAIFWGTLGRGPVLRDAYRLLRDRLRDEQVRTAVTTNLSTDYADFALARVSATPECSRPKGLYEPAPSTLSDSSTAPPEHRFKTRIPSSKPRPAAPSELCVKAKLPPFLSTNNMDW